MTAAIVIGDKSGEADKGRDMRVVDLSMAIDSRHFRWRTGRHLERAYEKGDPNQVTRIDLSCHAFTHVDSPRHFHPDGVDSDQSLTLDRLMGPAAVVDLSPVTSPNLAIEAHHLEAAGSHIEPGDIALIKTCWDLVEDVATPTFWTRAPYFTQEGAVWLRERGVNAAGFDFPQDYFIRFAMTGEPRPPREEIPTHYELLWRGNVILIEYLCNLARLTSPRTYVIALPLKIPACDGAPARVIAIEDAALDAPGAVL